MRQELQITVREFPHSAALDARIRSNAERLERFCSGIVGCRVVVMQSSKHKQHGKLYSVNIDLKVPGGELVVNQHRDEDVYVALRDAFAAARRKLEDFASRRRGTGRTGRARALRPIEV